MESDWQRHPTLFIHGMLVDALVWDPLRQLLPTTMCHCPTLPWSGNGDQHWMFQKDPAQQVAFHIKRIEHRRPIVVAHSFGTLALLNYLTTGSVIEEPACIVLLSPFFRSRQEEVDWKTFEFYVDGLSALIRESIGIRSNADRYHGELLDALVEKAREKMGVYSWLEFLKLFMSTPRMQLQRINSPCLLVTGEKDAYCSPEHCVDLASALKAASVVTIPDAGHFFLKTHPATLAESIKSFVRQHIGEDF